MTTYVNVADVEIEPEAPVTQALMQRLRDNPLALSAGALFGFGIANNAGDATNDIDFAAGVAVSDDIGDAIVLENGITKRLDAAWAAGTGQGGRDTGAIADGTWHAFAIKNPTTGAVDGLFSQSLLEPTLPAGFTLKRRVASVLRASSAILPFVQSGDRFYHSDRILDFNGNSTAGSGALLDISVPDGIPVVALGSLFAIASGVQYFMLQSPHEQAVTPTQDNCDIGLHTSAVFGSIHFAKLTSTAQLRAIGSTVMGIRLNTFGWIDQRGRFD